MNCWQNRIINSGCACGCCMQKASAVRFLFTARKNEKGKMEFLVTVPVDDAQFEVLERRYQTLIG